MKVFNKDKALRQIKLKQNKNTYIKKVSIVLSCFILLIGIMYFTFAKFESNSEEYTLINGVVKYGGSGDITLSYVVDGVSQSTPPAKGTGYKLKSFECTNATGRWDNKEWGLMVKNMTGKAKCNLEFEKTNGYLDGEVASIPELYEGLIPIYYNNNKPYVANVETEWYNYANHNWANAVLVENYSDYADGNGNIIASKIDTEITSGILQYYVWIPRYKYQLFNVNNGSVSEQMINVEFIDTDEINTKSESEYQNNEWYVHPAFTFGSTELSGFWVGKFETSNTVTDLKILPEVSSLRSINVSSMFNATRNMENQYSNRYGINSDEIDTHMMKNMEWGAMAYLSASKYGLYNSDGVTCYNTSQKVTNGCEITINSNSSYTTGRSGTSNAWNTTSGFTASSSGNQYGVYDMSGGSWEYVMGNRSNTNNSVYTTQSSGFTTQPESKYLDIYGASSSNTDHAKGKLGDATKETLKTFGNTSGGWYSDYAYFVESSYSWFVRGGNYSLGAFAGAFFFSRYTGEANTNDSFRVVLSAQ